MIDADFAIGERFGPIACTYARAKVIIPKRQATAMRNKTLTVAEVASPSGTSERSGYPEKCPK
jgi:hypothetical protein